MYQATDVLPIYKSAYMSHYFNILKLDLMNTNAISAALPFLIGYWELQ